MSAMVRLKRLLDQGSEVTFQVPPLPWVMDADGARWSAGLPDGRTAVIERLDDGVSFVPKVHESAGDFETGPVFGGVLSAAAWVTQFAAGAAE